MALLSMVHIHNAWILVVPVWLTGIAVAATNGRGMKRAADMSWYTSRDRFFSFASMVLMIAFMGASVFVPLHAVSWTYWFGLALVLGGCAANLVSKVTYARAASDAPIAGGIYRFSRNPMYASFSLVMAGAVVASGSALLLALWALTALCTHMLIRGEERYCLRSYGDAYREYLRAAPRYALFF